MERPIDDRYTHLGDDGRYQWLLAAFTELRAAAQHVVDETDRIHDGDPWPIKYRAPYGAITALRRVLDKCRVEQR